MRRWNVSAENEWKWPRCQELPIWSGALARSGSCLQQLGNFFKDLIWTKKFASKINIWKLMPVFVGIWYISIRFLRMCPIHRWKHCTAVENEAVFVKWSRRSCRTRRCVVLRFWEDFQQMCSGQNHGGRHGWLFYIKDHIPEVKHGTWKLVDGKEDSVLDMHHFWGWGWPNFADTPNWITQFGSINLSQTDVTECTLATSRPSNRKGFRDRSILGHNSIQIGTVV